MVHPKHVWKQVCWEQPRPLAGAELWLLKVKKKVSTVCGSIWEVQNEWHYLKGSLMNARKCDGVEAKWRRGRLWRWNGMKNLWEKTLN